MSTAPQHAEANHPSTVVLAHLICEVSDSGTPRLTRYQRVIVSTER